MVLFRIRMPNAISQLPFRAEKDLVAALHDATPEILSPRPDSGSCRVLKEVPVFAESTRIPDLLLVYQPDGSQGASIGLLSYMEAAVLQDLMSHDGGAIAEIAERLYCPIADVARCVLSLRKRGALMGDATMTVNWAAIPANLHIIAIEAKLTRWKDAVRQATEYFRFAHQSYIAMPAGVARRPAVLQECATFGVGVLAVEIDGQVSLVVQSDDRDPTGPAYLRLLSKATAPSKPSQKRPTNCVDD